MTDKQIEDLASAYAWANDTVAVNRDTFETKYVPVDKMVRVPIAEEIETAVIFGVKTVLNNVWKPDTDDERFLPPIDEEVIVLLDREGDIDLGDCYKVCFAHRPNPYGWEAKSALTGKAERYIPKLHGKGGWNIPGVKFWLDVDLPKQK